MFDTKENLGVDAQSTQGDSQVIYGYVRGIISPLHTTGDLFSHDG